ncbi:MAG: ABC transporter substrate-binding protein, partial [Flavobacteriales bacterium]|nr:ABC transporter substrate-binding protein [Flavobacteriales bacterium]
NGDVRLRMFDLEKNRDTLAAIDIHPSDSDRFVCLSTTHLAYIQSLQILDRVMAATSLDLVMDEEIRKRVMEGKIREVGAPSGVNAEQLLNLHPEIFFTYPFGDLQTELIERSGTRCIEVSEYLEQDPLARAEWVKFFGYVCGKGEASEQLFSSIRDAYLSAPVDTSVQKKRVLFVSTDGQYWYAPPGNSFIGHLLHDAGLDYVFADSLSNGNIIMDREQLLAAGAGCDALGIIGGFPDGMNQVIFDQQFPQVTLPCVEAGKVFYCNTATTDYFGKAVIEPQVLRNDLMHLFNADHTDDSNTTYFRILTSGY